MAGGGRALSAEVLGTGVVSSGALAAPRAWALLGPALVAESPMAKSTADVLVLEDERALAEMIVEELSGEGYAVTPTASVAGALEALKHGSFDVALLDLNVPDGSGLDVLKAISEEGLPTETIVLTGNATVSNAIVAMKLGAYDFLTKPTRMDELQALVSKAAEKARLRQENTALKAQLARDAGVEGLVTEDAAFKQTLAVLERVAPSDLPVLIQGESGTGKELIARAVHEKSARAPYPFMAISCGAVPETLLESELFGYERGAFTGALSRKPGLVELANRGVLFLDEIGDITAAVQSKLLRFAETQEFFHVGGTRPLRTDVRIVAATSKDLKHEVADGRYRQDLYQRLNGVTLWLPPLRDRRGDIPLLAAHFLQRYSLGKKTLSEGALDALKKYAWPGNVRELQMVVRRAAVLVKGDVIEPKDVSLDLSQPNWKSGALRAGLTLAELEKEYINTILQQHDGHRGRAAKALGIDPKTLYNKLGPEHPRKEGGD
jgi:DNA-binding NtrC family response regulator